MGETENNELIGWEDIVMTESEKDALCDFADAGNIEKAEAVVEGVRNRLFGEWVM